MDPATVRREPHEGGVHVTTPLSALARGRSEEHFAVDDVNPLHWSQWCEGPPLDPYQATIVAHSARGLWTFLVPSMILVPLRCPTF